MKVSDKPAAEEKPAAVKPKADRSAPTKQRRWPLVVSGVLNVVLLASLVTAMWKPEPVPFDPSKHTQQDIQKAMTVSYGADAASVKGLLGEPAVREVTDGREEWHYCKTGSTVDEYVAISFNDKRVVAVGYYNVSWLDLVFHYVKQPTEQLIDVGGMGDCRLTVRWGTYAQTTPSYPTNPPARLRNVEPATVSGPAR
ncbi:MAG: hypothetical protein CVU22_06545 [Betaproteobacteria bacterium HGW-Betaproteobacteria-16]|nr:MAG: hypothetical protein CVU22_06545 [Betaproteobacteria bacterium HGW-Betaproteobacteria-16]